MLVVVLFPLGGIRPVAQMSQIVLPASSSREPNAVPLTDQDTIVLADFDNKTGEVGLDDAMTQALTIELSQSPFLNVLSDRKARETLGLVGHPSNGKITSELGQAICLHTASKVVVAGTISNTSGHYLIGLTARACGNGEILATEQFESASQQDILKTLSQASSNLRSELGESTASVEKFNTPLETITTSLEALRNYSLGITMQREQGDTPSVPFLKRAIELDPNFAQAYATLAGIYGNLRQPSLALECATKAYALRDRGTERQRLRIASSYFLATGEIEKEIQTYNVWKTNYPRDFVPHNNLGNDYAAIGQLEKALAEYQEALHITPSVVGYTNVGGMYINLNRFEEAKEAFSEAIAKKLDGRYIRQSMYWVAFLLRDEELMEQEVAWASGKPGDEDVLWSLQSDTEAYYGRLGSSREFTQRAVESAVHAGEQETAALWKVNGALREAELGNISVARKGVTAALALSSGRDVSVIAAFTLARAGDTRQARLMMDELEKRYPTDTIMKFYWLPCLHAAIELSDGNSSKALADLQAAAPYELGGAATFINYLYPAYLRGQAFLMAHKPRAAQGEFQKLLDHSGIVVNFVTGALVHLQLGRAYAMAGETDRARKAYEDFFAEWRNADKGTSIVKQARSEYSTLQEHM